MYRRTKKYSAQRLAAMQAGRERARMEKPAPAYPAALPDLRMRITVEMDQAQLDDLQERLAFIKGGWERAVVRAMNTARW